MHICLGGITMFLIIIIKYPQCLSIQMRYSQACETLFQIRLPAEKANKNLQVVGFATLMSKIYHVDYI